ncbi:MAG: hypothetical protein HZY76_00895 [Anaerolineae bacterium]|nr:MAG: hypothetical protein HZY76_00895 [Anaerolineae bacterium]
MAPRSRPAATRDCRLTTLCVPARGVGRGGRRPQPHLLHRGSGLRQSTDRADPNLAAGFAFLANANPGSGLFDDGGLVNGAVYYYRLRCAGVGGWRSGYSAVVHGLPKADSLAPEGLVIIDSGAEHSADLDVSLSIDAPDDVTHMQIANRPDFQGAAWIPLATSTNWTLAPHPVTGEAFVYVRFHDAAGNVSIIAGDDIRYQPPFEVTVPAAGGAFDSPDHRLHLIVPAGALPANTIFRYTRLERPADAPSPGHAYGGAPTDGAPC